MADLHSLSSIRTLARFYALDTDTTNQFASDATYTSHINKWYRWIVRFGGPRVIRESSTDCGLTLAIGAYSMLTTPTNYLRIVKLFTESATGTTSGNELEFMERGAFELLRKLGGSSETTPHYWSAWRESSPAAGASVGKWRVVVTPVADATRYFSVLAEKGITELSGDSDIPDILPHEGDILARLVGADMLTLMGRDAAKREAVLSGIPQEMRESLNNADGTGKRAESN